MPFIDIASGQLMYLHKTVVGIRPVDAHYRIPLSGSFGCVKGGSIGVRPSRRCTIIKINFTGLTFSIITDDIDVVVMIHGQTGHSHILDIRVNDLGGYREAFIRTRIVALGIVDPVVFFGRAKFNSIGNMNVTTEVGIIDVDIDAGVIYPISIRVCRHIGGFPGTALIGVIHYRRGGGNGPLGPSNVRIIVPIHGNGGVVAII
ncbi:hypothetical protein ES703_119193 [subsurface metagenome]